MVDERSGRPNIDQANKNLKRNQKKPNRERVWLVVCRLRSCKVWNPKVAARIQRKLVDDDIPEHGDSISNQFFSWRILRTHFKKPWGFVFCVNTMFILHFPKDRNCEICQRTQITRAQCRRRNGGVVPRAENLEDLIDHSRSPGFQLIIANLETITGMPSWCSTWPLNWSKHFRGKQKLHRKHTKKLASLWSPIRSQSLGIRQILWTSFPESLHVNTRSSPQSYGRQDDLWKTFWATIQWTDFSIWFIGWVSPYNFERSVKNPSIWNESFSWIVPQIRHCELGWSWKGWRTDCRPWGVGNDGTHWKAAQKDSNWKRWYFPNKENLLFQ